VAFNKKNRPSLRDAMDQELQWSIEPEVLSPSCRVYRITRQAASGVSKEAMEYNMWAAQLAKLSHVPINQIAQVDRVLYSAESPVIQAYYSKKRELGASGKGYDIEQYVFHGTGTETALRSIVTNGFIIGGTVAGVPILNGAAHGQGVYTAIGPTTPMGYGVGTGKVVLARTMPGVLNIHSVRPNGDWIVFRDPALLLPLAIITFGPPGIALPGMAVPAMARATALAQAAHQAAVQAAAAAAAKAAAKAAADAAERAAALQEEQEFDATLAMSLSESTANKARLAQEREDERRAIEASMRETRGRGPPAGLSQSDSGFEDYDGVIAYTEEELAIMASAQSFREEEEQRRLLEQQQQQGIYEWGGEDGAVVNIAAAAAPRGTNDMKKRRKSLRDDDDDDEDANNHNGKDNDNQDDESVVLVVGRLAAKRARQHGTQPQRHQQPQPGAVVDLTRGAVIFTIEDD